jgi:hypothetical protein
MLTFLALIFFAPWWRRRYDLPKRRLSQEPHGLTSHKTAFFIVAAVKVWNLISPWTSLSFNGLCGCLLKRRNWLITDTRFCLIVKLYASPQVFNRQGTDVVVWIRQCRHLCRSVGACSLWWLINGTPLTFRSCRNVPPIPTHSASTAWRPSVHLQRHATIKSFNSYTFALKNKWS